MYMFLTREHQNTWGKKNEKQMFPLPSLRFQYLCVRKDWSSRQKTSMDIAEFNNSNNHLDISYFYRLSHNRIYTLLKHMQSMRLQRLRHDLAREQQTRPCPHLSQLVDLVNSPKPFKDMPPPPGSIPWFPKARWGGPCSPCTFPLQLCSQWDDCVSSIYHLSILYQLCAGRGWAL